MTHLKQNDNIMALLLNRVKESYSFLKQHNYLNHDYQ